MGGLIEQELNHGKVLEQLEGQAVCIDLLFRAVENWFPEFSGVHVSSGPPSNFTEDAWPVLVQSMGSAGWYLSTEELLVLCDLARTNVIIVQQIFEEHEYRSSIITHL